ncbi:hypothetical protein JG688_00014489 [Phytophthora aleatoria]|uniref:ZSWIM1/3 RNaseH-like domain-containing protein n=1 Tax=Phytophthora aleatoria TaxID=2496075 RepID=A0A8J5IBT7_9STRA|nr:hypothetical protein JG688_00014489 [Phytophthora aleatoria]
MLDAFGQTNTDTKQIVSYVAGTTGTYYASAPNNVNNGTLVATVPTGRGVSVLDYLLLNQQKTTLLVVLKWFKMKNPSWGRLQSLVIDKVFT